MKISELTRRDIIDAMTVEGVNWCGRLDETAFLNRIYDLRKLPSTDGRFEDAEGDIWQHRVNNDDWNDDWVFHDDRFNLLQGDDEIFLRFLCETIHPVVRSDSTEVERLKQLYNERLVNDGCEIAERSRISGKPVFVGRYVGSAMPGIATAKAVRFIADKTYVAQQITRMESAVYNDPGLAIGTAKELVETCCRTILEERGVEVFKNAELSQLVKATAKTLQLTPDDIPEEARASETIKRLLSNLAAITQGIAELRNQYGTGHGKSASSKGLQPRHAKLMIGAASTLAVFLIETYEAKSQ